MCRSEDRLDKGKLYVDTRLGGREKLSLGKPADYDMRVPDTIKQCVCFLCVKIDERYHYGGTAFFVSIPSETFPEEVAYPYLVTAKHCIEQAKARGSDLYVRLNKHGGGAVQVRLESDWAYLENPASDVAVVLAPMQIHEPLIEYESLPIDMAATDEVMTGHDFGIGSDLLITGLFTHKAGKQRNLPIVRQGIIAAMLDEPLIDKGTGYPYDAYLAEVRSISGLSGSPVFVSREAGEEIDRSPGQIIGVHHQYSRIYFLLGLVRGHWDEDDAAIDYSKGKKEAINVGIATITPVTDLLKLLDAEDLVRERKRLDKQIIIEDAPTPDNDFVA